MVERKNKRQDGGSHSRETTVIYCITLGKIGHQRKWAGMNCISLSFYMSKARLCLFAPQKGYPFLMQIIFSFEIIIPVIHYVLLKHILISPKSVFMLLNINHLIFK